MKKIIFFIFVAFISVLFYGCVATSINDVDVSGEIRFQETIIIK